MDALKPEIITAVRKCCEAIIDKKAEDIRIFNVQKISNVTDVVIIATGNSGPHLRALQGAISGAVKEESFSLGGVDYSPQSGWVVVDGYQFMVHLLLPEDRELRNLEQMWRHADEIKISDIMP